MYLRQTGRYFLPSRESFQSIVLSSQFDWLAFFEVAGSSNYTVHILKWTIVLNQQGFRSLIQATTVW